jgi:hypothetical protein
MDATVVSAWLSRANENVEKLSSFCNAGDNFVRFAHFWLSDFPGVEKQEVMTYPRQNQTLDGEVEVAYVSVVNHVVTEQYLRLSVYFSSFFFLILFQLSPMNLKPVTL